MVLGYVNQGRDWEGELWRKTLKKFGKPTPTDAQLAELSEVQGLCRAIECIQKEFVMPTFYPDTAVALDTGKPRSSDVIDILAIVSTRPVEWRHRPAYVNIRRLNELMGGKPTWYYSVVV